MTLTQKFMRLGIALILPLAMVACSGTESSPESADTATPAEAADDGTTDEETPQDSASAEPYVIDVILSTSGGAALYGGQGQQSVQAYFDKYLADTTIDGRPVVMNAYDEQTDPNLALSLLRRAATDDEAIAVVGLSSNATYKPALPIIQDNELPTMATVGRFTFGEERSGSPYVYTVAIDHLSYMERVGDLYAERYDQVAVIASDDGFGAATSEVIQNTWNEKDLEFELFTIPYEASDLTQQMSEIANGGFEAVFVQAAGFGGITAIKNLRQVGFEGTIIGQPTYTTQGAQEGIGDLIEGLVVVTLGVPSDPLPRQEDMMTTVQEKYPDASIGFIHYGAWDAMAIVHRALESATPDPSDIEEARRTLNEAIESTSGYEGAGGVYNYSPDDHVGTDPQDSFVFAVYDSEGGLQRIAVEDIP